MTATTTRDHSMSIVVDYQLAVPASDEVPNATQIQTWLTLAIPQSSAEVTVRIVNRSEIQMLNRDYRSQDKATNVLSFPFEPWQSDAPVVDEQLANTANPAATGAIASEQEAAINDYLGDIVICAEVVTREAAAQKKPLLHHWAHLIIHGALHLLGYDHIKEQEAAVMEALEVAILTELGIDDPYRDRE